jgi:hypothetical protein
MSVCKHGKLSLVDTNSTTSNRILWYTGIVALVAPRNCSLERLLCTFCNATTEPKRLLLRTKLLSPWIKGLVLKSRCQHSMDSSDFPKASFLRQSDVKLRRRRELIKKQRDLVSYHARVKGSLSILNPMLDAGSSDCHVTYPTLALQMPS